MLERSQVEVDAPDDGICFVVAGCPGDDVPGVEDGHFVGVRRRGQAVGTVFAAVLFEQFFLVTSNHSRELNMSARCGGSTRFVAKELLTVFQSRNRWTRRTGRQREKVDRQSGRPLVMSCSLVSLVELHCTGMEFER